MLTLVFPKKELTSASIQIRWCLDSQTLQKIEATQRKPFILIKLDYTKRSQSKADYQLFPLGQYTSYIDLHFSGPVSISAVIVTASCNSKYAIERCFLYNTYDRNDVYENTEYLIKVTEDPNVGVLERTVNTFDISPSYKFDIDSSLFGKELSARQKFYVNRYWYSEKHKCKDECDQRRRLMLFPFTTLPILIVEFLARFLFNLSATLAHWSILVPVTTKYICHPFTKFEVEDTEHLFTKVCGKIDQKYSQEWYHGIFLFLSIPFIPLLALIAIITIDCNTKNILRQLISTYFIGAYDFELIIVLAAIVSTFSLTQAKKLGSYLNKKLPKVAINILDSVLNVFEHIFEGFLKIAFYPVIIIEKFMYKEDITSEERHRSLLTCDDNTGSCLPELKASDKSVKLIFADLKNKVCKPLRG